MRTEVELVLLGQSLMDVTFPVHKETLTEIFRTKSKTLHPDKGGNEESFKLLNSVYQEIMSQPKNGTFFLGDGQAGAPEPKDVCWNCGGDGELVESFRNPNTHRVEIKSREKCTVCRGNGRITREELKQSMSGVKPGEATHIPNHVQ